jgi:hypothetical protein
MESSGNREFTLIDFLKLMAIIMPCVWIVMYSPRLGLWGVISGLLVGVAMAILQFVGHYHCDSWLDRRRNGTDPSLASVLVYYIGTLATGIACSLVTLEVARFVAQATIA